MTEDERALPPEQMMALLKQQQRKIDRELIAPIPWLLGIWGVAWLVGFLLLWSAYEGGNPWFRVPGIVAGLGFGVLIIASIVASRLSSIVHPPLWRARTTALDWAAAGYRQDGFDVCHSSRPV